MAPSDEMQGGDHRDHGDEKVVTDGPSPDANNNDAAAVDETLKEGADMGNADTGTGDQYEDASGDELDAEVETETDDGPFDDVKHDITEELRMLKGLSDGTISREAGRAFIAEHYPELND